MEQRIHCIDYCPLLSSCHKQGSELPGVQNGDIVEINVVEINVDQRWSCIAQDCVPHPGIEGPTVVHIVH